MLYQLLGIKKDPLTIYGGEHIDYVGGGMGVIIKRKWYSF